MINASISIASMTYVKLKKKHLLPTGGQNNKYTDKNEAANLTKKGTPNNSSSSKTHSDSEDSKNIEEEGDTKISSVKEGVNLEEISRMNN
ncbi:hypothetical protein Anas_13291 [Armadillidium nasatum]|uniref:Uncharacterized protein n=1 Tax=Armadillidium nasatum TaxID=96803 RepID=A0A5N5SL95_9CRUS|nr:hypothetical protein Anas_13291 [Armadillidium nasatum]